MQIYVRPEYSFKGIGTKILKALIDKAKEKDVHEVHCSSSLNAERFYIKEGFIPGKKYKHNINGGELICIPMRKILK